MARTPFLVVGDGPAEPTGLARIARDLTAQIVQDFPGLDVVQVGGAVPPVWPSWRHQALDRGEDWGAGQVQAYWETLFGTRPGILFCVWDPARLFTYAALPIPAQKWGYCAVDAENARGGISGPAAEALSSFDRVIAYGRWGSRILKSCRSPVPYLPHGIFAETFSPFPTADEWAATEAVLGPYVGDRWILGCVATNQARKDLGLYCQTLKALQDAGEPVYGWLHTDRYVKDWSIPQLVQDLGLHKQLTVTLAEDGLSDRQLACLYHRCGCTLAPGLGEGFGYPIVESLACGIPCVHHTYAGGAELLPKPEWRMPVRAWRLESCYALKRPVLDPEDARNAILRAVRWREAVGEEVCREYCQGAVAHLDWQHLWPRWAAWIRSGLKGTR